MMRVARVTDIPFIQGVLNQEDNLDKLETYSDQQLIEAIEDPGQRIWIADHENHAAGFIWFTHLIGGSRGPKLEEFGVGQPGRGLGSAMLREAMEALQREISYPSIWLAVAADNEAAIRFYKRHGFVESEVRPSAWSRRKGPVADALIMVRREL